MRIHILVLILIGILVYFNSLTNAFVGDDFNQIVNNLSVHSWTNFFHFFESSTYESGGGQSVAGLYFRPVMLSIYSVIYSLFGPRPFFFHLFQIVLHTANVLLIYFFLKKFLRNNLSFVAALIFLVHPLNVEAVVYIADLQDLLFFFFGMLALFLVGKPATGKLQLLIPVLLLLSLLSKESGILFFPILLLAGAQFKWRPIKMILWSEVLALLTYLVLRFGVAKMYQAQDSLAPITNSPLVIRLLNLPASAFYYLKTFFFPGRLISNQYWVHKTANWESFYLPALVLLIAGILFLLTARLIYKHHKFLWPRFLFFGVWFLLGLGLHLNIYPLDSTVADRWFYFPMMGLLAILMLTVERFKLDKKFPKILIIVTFLIVSLLGARTVARNFDWRDGLTLYRSDIELQPRNFLLDNGLGTELIISGRLKEAKPYIESSVKTHPFYANINNLAMIKLSEGDTEGSKKSLQQALKLGANYQVYENYANFLLHYYSKEETFLFTTQALKRFPNNSKLQSILKSANKKALPK